MSPRSWPAQGAALARARAIRALWASAEAPRAAPPAAPVRSSSRRDSKRLIPVVLLRRAGSVESRREVLRDPAAGNLTTLQPARQFLTDRIGERVEVFEYRWWAYERNTSVMVALGAAGP